MRARPPRRIGYGYKRGLAEFEGAACDRVFIDTPKTGRDERHVMMQIALHPGDTLVLLGKGDLGYGRELRNLREKMADDGVTIEVYEPPEDEPRKPGPPAAHPWTEEDTARFGRLWKDLSRDGGYVITEACHLMGEDPKDDKARERVRQRLIRKFGSRGKR